MKKGRIILLKRFWNKNKGYISNGIFAMSILFFCITCSLVVFGNPFKEKVANASYEVNSETKEVIDVDGDIVITIDNKEYEYPNASQKATEMLSYQSSNNGQAHLELLLINDNPINLIATFN